MTSRDFCFWLQGLFELGTPTTLDEKQLELVKRHLNMVFLHEIDPSAGPPEKQAALDAAHQGKPPSPHLTTPNPPGWTGPVMRC
jgi:hypothetical protein